MFEIKKAPHAQGNKKRRQMSPVFVINIISQIGIKGNIKPAMRRVNL